MAQPGRPLLIVVRPGRRTRTVLGWLRQLLPAAVLLVVPPGLDPPEGDAEVITLDADAGEAGPLSLAAVIARARDGR